MVGALMRRLNRSDDLFPDGQWKYRPSRGVQFHHPYDGSASMTWWRNEKT
jgi:hypothetical protein